MLARVDTGDLSYNPFAHHRVLPIASSDRLDWQPRRLFHLSRQREVERADAPGVMRRQVHHDTIEDIEPFGVMVLLLGHKRAAGHKAECFGKVAELVFAVQLALVQRPAGQLSQSGLYFAIGEFGNFHALVKSRLRAWAYLGTPRRRGCSLREKAIHRSLRILRVGWQPALPEGPPEATSATAAAVCRNVRSHRGVTYRVQGPSGPVHPVHEPVACYASPTNFN